MSDIITDRIREKIDSDLDSILKMFEGDKDQLLKQFEDFKHSDKKFTRTNLESFRSVMDHHKYTNYNKDLIHSAIVEKISLKESLLGYKNGYFTAEDFGLSSSAYQYPIPNFKVPVESFYQSGEFEDDIHKIQLQIVGFGGSQYLQPENVYYNYGRGKFAINSGHENTFNEKSWWLDGAESGEMKQAVFSVDDAKYWDVGLEYVVKVNTRQVYVYIVFQTYRDKIGGIVKNKMRVRSGRMGIGYNYGSPIYRAMRNSGNYVSVGHSQDIEDFNKCDAQWHFRSSPGQQGGIQLFSLYDYVNNSTYADDRVLNVFNSAANKKLKIPNMLKDMVVPPKGGSIGFGMGDSEFIEDVFYLNDGSYLGSDTRRFKFSIINVVDELYEMRTQVAKQIDDDIRNKIYDNKKYSYYIPGFQSWYSAQSKYIHLMTDEFSNINRYCKIGLTAKEYSNYLADSNSLPSYQTLLDRNEKFNFKVYGDYKNNNNPNYGYDRIFKKHASRYNFYPKELNYTNRNIPIGAGTGGIPSGAIPFGRISSFIYGGDGLFWMLKFH